MAENVLELLSARRGHFLLESGHHGDLWFDLEAWKHYAITGSLRQSQCALRSVSIPPMPSKKKCIWQIAVPLVSA